MKVAKTKTNEWPSGRAFAIMEMLLKKHRPKDILSKVHQKKKLMKLKLKNGQDPDEFGTAIASLEIEYRNTFEEEDKIAALVGAAGPQYATTIISETKRVAGSNKNVTCDELIEAMSEHWRMSGEGKSFVEDEPTETALANPGKFETNGNTTIVIRLGI